MRDEIMMIIWIVSIAVTAIIALSLICDVYDKLFKDARCELQGWIKSTKHPKRPKDIRIKESEHA